MRKGILIVGVVLAVIGAVLLFIPVTPQASQSIDSNSATPFTLFQVSGFSITGSIAVSVSWTANTTVTMAAVTCSAACAGGNASSIAGLALQSGTSGSFTLGQPNGGYVLVGIFSSGSGSPPAHATLNVTTAQSTVGSIVLILGIVLLIVGVVLKSKSKMAPAPAEPMMTSPEMPPAEPAPMPPPTS